MIIPNADRAVIDIRKLRDYCLNPAHSEGKHKARLFSAKLGITRQDAEALREILSKKVLTEPATVGRRDDFGQRYIIDFEFEWQGQHAILRSGWIIEHDQNEPRLTTCYPL